MGNSRQFNLSNSIVHKLLRKESKDCFQMTFSNKYIFANGYCNNNKTNNVLIEPMQLSIEARLTRDRIFSSHISMQGLFSDDQVGSVPDLYSMSLQIYQVR
ncbi:hypothetical protein CDAR_503831 [Caerostris darwini]|uniref:Uncharacterized protein n=1 Tax=Caerostris darwini TaxID=1538125 RepID=A0AAV4PIB0_9ARAC|nr:hypothetical protein CDAR_503831 [Caerostris darwini]